MWNGPNIVVYKRYIRHPQPALDMTLDANQEVWYTIVFWIHETGANQNADQGAAFSGGINFTTEGSGSGVTAILSATQAPSRS